MNVTHSAYNLNSPINWVTIPVEDVIYGAFVFHLRAALSKA